MQRSYDNIDALIILWKNLFYYLKKILFVNLLNNKRNFLVFFFIL